MVRNEVVIGIIIFALFSCNFETDSKLDQSNSTSTKSSNLTWKIRNTQLIEQIELYYELVGNENNDENVLRVYCKNEGDISKYYLNFFLGFYSFYHTPIHLIVELDEKMIGVSFAGLNDFNLSKESYIGIMKEKFPSAYTYYQKMKKLAKTDTTYSYSEKDLFPPPNTGGYETWILTFKDGKMIDKKIER